MALRRTDHAHYSGEQVREHVREALQVADDCGLSDAERIALLPSILDKLAAKQVIMEEIGTLPHMVIPQGLG